MNDLDENSSNLVEELKWLMLSIALRLQPINELCAYLETYSHVKSVEPIEKAKMAIKEINEVKQMLNNSILPMQLFILKYENKNMAKR